jgi:MbtH protein
MHNDTDDDHAYKVVVNEEEQYSIWLAHRPPPAGWREVGQQGRKEECLAYIKEVWTDMRPLSLRERMDQLPNQLQEGRS